MTLATLPNRDTSLDIQPEFLTRWSPRALQPKPLPEAELMRLFEASRWAPSASNLQPWRFAYAHRDTPDFAAYLEALVPFNQDWAQHASVLIFLSSVSTFDGERPVPTQSFDAGAAWMSLALQAQAQGLIAHAMAGYDQDKAARAIQLPPTMKLEAAIAIGYQGDKNNLPESLRTREVPSDRQPLHKIIVQGHF